MVFGLRLRATEVSGCSLVHLKRNQHPEVHPNGMDARYWGGQEMAGRKILPVHASVRKLPFGLSVQSVPLQIEELIVDFLHLPSAGFAVGVLIFRLSSQKG